MYIASMEKLEIFEWIITQLLNSAFIWHEELCRLMLNLITPKERDTEVYMYDSYTCSTVYVHMHYNNCTIDNNN